MPSFKCRDSGVNCDFKVEASTLDELLAKIAEHAKNVHKMETISPELMAKVKAAIKS